MASPAPGRGLRAADILTGGRVVFGVGRGYHTREVEVFGSPLLDQEANRDMFEEQVEIILKSFNEASFSHHGKYYTIPPRVPYRGYDLEEITLVPRPGTLPVECWQPIQSATPRGLDFMARHGINGIIGGGVAEGGAMEKVVLAYRDALARAGRESEPGEGLSVGFSFYIDDTVEKAMAEAGKLYEENLKMFVAAGPKPRRRAGRGDERPPKGSPRRSAQDPGRGEGRRIPLRPAGKGHRGPSIGGGQVSGAGTCHATAAGGHAPVGDLGADGAVRQGGHARLRWEPPGRRPRGLGPQIG